METHSTLDSDASLEICRTCLNKNLPLHQMDNSTKMILQECVSIKINDDPAHKLICVNCKRIVNEFLRFKMRCLEIELFLRKGKSKTFGHNIFKIKEENRSDVQIEAGVLSRTISDEIEKQEEQNCWECGEKFNDLSKLLAHVRFHINLIPLSIEANDSFKHDITIDGLREENSKDFTERSNCVTTIVKCNNEINNQKKATGKKRKLKKPRSLKNLVYQNKSINDRNIKRRCKKEIIKECLKCKKKIKKSSAFKRHMVSSHKNDSTDYESLCPFCGMKCSQYIRHIKVCPDAIHVNNKLLKCRFCKAEFQLMTNLRDHHKIHHNDDIVREGLRFQCELCGKKFSRSKNLYHHRVTHKEEKPFNCNICPKQFKRIRELKAHMQVHKGEKPFTCGTCEARFRERSKLKRHMLIHTGEKPFACELCPETFARTDKLKLHMAKHSQNLFRFPLTDGCKNSDV